MADFIFGFLESIGFNHPLHPIIVSLPMGLILGGFAFVVAAIFFAKPVFLQTAHHTATLALITVPPTVLLGALDWQYSFDGQWMMPIKIKIGLSVAMTLLLIILYRIGGNGKESPSRYLIVYGLTVLTAIGMGYTGGQLIFG